jgi:ABC-type multidrug transport system fused ATPase/permease subunit
MATMPSRSLLKRLLRESLREPGRLVVAGLTLAGQGATQLALTWLVKSWVEGPLVHGHGSGDPSSLLSLAVALALLLAGFILASRIAMASVRERLVERLRNAATARLLAAEPVTVRAYPTGDLLSRVLQDAGQLSGFVEQALRRFLGDGGLALGALALMFALNAKLALATCAVAVVVGLLLVGLGTVVRRWGAVAQRTMGELAATFQEQLQGFTTVKGYRTEAHEAARFAATNAAYRHRAVRAEGWTAFMVATVSLLAVAGFAAAVAHLTGVVAAGGLSAGGLLAFCLFAGQTVEPLRRLAEVHGLLQRCLAAAERLFELVDAPVPPAAAAPPTRTRRPAARLAIEALHFRYRGEEPLLEGVSLALEPGERIAVVATSGAGKSTLAALLLRFRAPDAGRIALDGRDVRELDLAALRDAVCVVEQEPFMLRGSLLDNLRYGSFEVGVGEVEKAARLAGLGPLIDAAPEGLLVPCAEAGRSLSGGQRQRVALARAVVRDPALLVLDEATSAVDSETEEQILADLDEWLAGRTVIVMAHRLSTIRRAPRIALLLGGRIAADGTLEELLASSEAFRALFAAQLT